MRNLKAVIQYECTTSFKYIWIFYGIMYAVIAFITVLVGISTGDFSKVTTNCLEINTLIYVGILGALGFREDFKMLIQNGFTRKYIFIATFSMFCFISGTMALVDTAAGNLHHYFNQNYDSVFGGIYGYKNLFANWLWLFLLYVAVCCLLYLVVLVINKLGKSSSICLGIAFGGAVLVLIALFKYVFSRELVNSFINFMIKAMGFMADGTINLLFPVLTLLAAAAVLGGGAYAVLRRTELK